MGVEVQTVKPGDGKHAFGETILFFSTINFVIFFVFVFLRFHLPEAW